MDEIAVLIPCFNECQTVAKVVSDWKRELPEATIYVYDNNSTDGTDEAARNAGAIVRYETQQGKGAVVRRMFREIDAKCYIMVDGDDTYPAVGGVGKKMVHEVLNHQADMVVGDRLSSNYFTENKRKFHNFGNVLVRGAINHLFRSDVRDAMTGCRAFSYLFVKTFPVLSIGYEVETEMTIHAVDKNMRIRNVVVPYKDRPAGSVSKLNTLRDGFRVLLTVLRLYKDYRPLRFLGTVSMVLYFLSAAIFIPVMTEFVRTGLVPHLPRLIACGFTAIMASLLWIAGLILQTLIRKDRQAFEFRAQVCMDEYRRKLGIFDQGN